MLYGQLSEYTVNGETLHAIKVTIPNPPKSAYLRFPSVDELGAFYNPPKNGKKETDDERLMRLFLAVRVDKGGPEFDEYEAPAALDDLVFKCSGISYERVGDGYSVVVRTPFGITTHVLSIPTQKQLTLFRRAGVKNYRPAVVGLYDQLVTSTDGYADNFPVPSNHKMEAAHKVLEALDDLDPIVNIDPNV